MKFEFTKQRQSLIPVYLLCRIQTGNDLIATIKILSYFVTVKEAFVSPEKGEKMILELAMGELEKLLDDFSSQMGTLQLFNFQFNIGKEEKGD